MSSETVSRKEFVETYGTLMASQIRAIQLLTLTLERAGAIEPGDFAGTIASYLESDEAQRPEEAGRSAFLSDLMEHLEP